MNRGSASPSGAGACRSIDGGTQRLPRIVGLGRALDLILTGRIMDAEEAHAIGLLTEIVPAGRHLDRALEMAEALARFPQDTMLADRLRGDRGHRAARFSEGLAMEARSGAAHTRDGLARRGALRRRRGPRRCGRLAWAVVPAIEVTDLRKSYGPVEAVRGLSFYVERGEVFGLLGPNGAGKTTTVEILEGYRKRSSGEVRVLGRDPQERDRDLQQRVGIVLQSCGFYPRVTVREAVEHFGKAYSRAARRRRDDRAGRARREGRHARPRT